MHGVKMTGHVRSVMSLPRWPDSPKADGDGWALEKFMLLAEDWTDKYGVAPLKLVPVSSWFESEFVPSNSEFYTQPFTGETYCVTDSKGKFK